MLDRTARRCFVISPIGLPGSDTRDHADDVYDYIIKPAMAEVGIEVHRADHDQRVGRITDHMFESILGDDLCIAVLTFHNPNVFYELAVAQSAAKPVIILNLDGHPLPFDIKDLRVVHYTFRPKMIQEKVYVRQIVEMVRNLDQLGWVTPVPFGHRLLPLGHNRGDNHIHDRVEGFGLSDKWIALLRAATRAIDLSGITLKYWLRIPGFWELLREKGAAGCTIRVLLAHPDNPALPGYMNQKFGFTWPRVVEDVRESNRVFAELAATTPGVEVRQMKVNCHHQQVVRSDDAMLVSLVMYSESTRRSPLIETTAKSPFFVAMLAEFDAIWAANPPDSPAAPNG